MLKLAVLVSGGGTNLQAVIDGIEAGTITNAVIDVVISNNKNAYALERAKKHGIEAKAISPKDYETRDVYVQEGDTPEILQRRIMEEAEWIIMPKAIDDIANGRIQVADGKVVRKS